MQDYLEAKPTVCAVCGGAFDASTRNRGKGVHKYCSKRCRQRADNQRHYRRRNPKKTEAELNRECVICGISFVTDAHHPSALTCSVKCNSARMDRVRREKRAKRQDLSARACEECGTLYTPHPISAHKQKFCSKRCQNRVMQRRRERPTGKYKRLMRKDFLDAKARVLERDSSKCRLCGMGEGRLHVHHIFHRTEVEMHDHSLENLITLCDSCHGKIHDIRVGRVDGEVVVSGAVFDLLGVDSVKVVQ